MTNALTNDEREIVAAALADYAMGVQENIADDDMRDHDVEMDGTPSERDLYPVVEDYLADADRILAGEQPLNELTWEVLRDDTGPAALVEDEALYRSLVERLLS